MQAIGSLTTLTALHLPVGSKWYGHAGVYSGLAFAQLQPLSSLTRLHTLETVGWYARETFDWMPRANRVGLAKDSCMPSVEVLSSWFPSLQVLQYTAGQALLCAACLPAAHGHMGTCT